MNTENDKSSDWPESDCYAGVEPPSHFMPQLEALRQRNEHAKDWTLRLERKTNRHPETCGHPWGWYEVFPLGQVIGHWGSDCDDLKGCDIKQWNEEADRISSIPTAPQSLDDQIDEMSEDREKRYIVVFQRGLWHFFKGEIPAEIIMAADNGLYDVFDITDPECPMRYTDEAWTNDEVWAT